MIKSNAVCCAAVLLCSGASAMVEDGSGIVNKGSQQIVFGQKESDQLELYMSDIHKRRSARTNDSKAGYNALQKDYPHKKSNFEETKGAFEKILSDIRLGTFKNPDMQLVLDYMHYWYDIDPEQVYDLEKTDRVTSGGEPIWRVYEYEIRDLAANILDELLQTGGLAYSRLH